MPILNSNAAAAAASAIANKQFLYKFTSPVNHNIIVQFHIHASWIIKLFIKTTQANSARHEKGMKCTPIDIFMVVFVMLKV